MPSNTKYKSSSIDIPSLNPPPSFSQSYETEYRSSEETHYITEQNKVLVPSEEYID